MDFTVDKYRELLKSIITAGYNFQTFDSFLRNPLEKVVILRHDVDLLPHNSLRFAEIQKELNAVGTYYFRAVPESWDENVIIKIKELGHEIGYHYESLTTTSGNLENGIKDFKNNLVELRKLASVTTICMHGSPMSKYDSKDLWKTYNYRDFDLIGEPYFDVDFNKVLYLTDTGRRWDGHKVSVRDRVKTSYKETFHKTDEIIDAFIKNELPNQIMFTFHPQRWHESKVLWVKEFLLQNTKNFVKKQFYVKNNS